MRTDVEDCKIDILEEQNLKKTSIDFIFFRLNTHVIFNDDKLLFDIYRYFYHPDDVLVKV